MFATRHGCQIDVFSGIQTLLVSAVEMYHLWVSSTSIQEHTVT